MKTISITGSWESSFDKNIEPLVIDSDGNIIGTCKSIYYDKNECYNKDEVILTIHTKANFMIDKDKHLLAICVIQEGDNNAI